jgi:hypothetical protein
MNFKSGTRIKFSGRNGTRNVGGYRRERVVRFAYKCKRSFFLGDAIVQDSNLFGYKIVVKKIGYLFLIPRLLQLSEGCGIIGGFVTE